MIFLFQPWIRSRGGLTMPYDSTIGVGPGFYWFSLAVIIFIALGVVRVLIQDGKWRGRVVHFNEKKDKSAQVPRAKVLTQAERESIILALKKKKLLPRNE